ncbi:hypothetical protein Dthio_PD1427 [Desulfonatronospira thiodismutans ASO3-1]|uniref:Uncharacterized protein n=1 Tax=Desulfonatronospira thiodismutans ASO3-1 TaxID=555779 RepID=D6STS1_9BACT|nr:terminase small subunit [Desulfonatronospira thiodismutans]EFI34087.1 hypothetical protein Dthio_PD1427 [Desulfonatronospira thiodismutans ASO3-1]
MRRRKPGRPRLYSNAPQMQERINSYFDACHEWEEIPTVSGLCLHLGFTDPSALKYYATASKAHAHFSKAIRRALMKIEACKAQALVDGELEPGRLRGLMFDLRVNHDWREKVSVKAEEPGNAGCGVAVIGWEKFNENWQERMLKGKA